MPLAQIKASLIQLLDAIKRADGPRVSAEMESLDRLAAAHRGALPGQLAHFLERRSYAKALAYIEADESARTA